MRNALWTLMLGWLGIYGVALYLQQHLLINCDVSYFIHALTLWLKGGTYTANFFNPNPPLVLFLYALPLGVTTLFKISVVTTTKAYVFMVATLSLSLCTFLSGKIFEPADVFIRNTFLLALASAFLILPLYEFGQRDHFLLMLTMPYVMLFGLRMQKITCNPYLAIVIGVVAGLGFCIKPQFFMVPLVLEMYYAATQKSFRAWIRPELVSVLAVSFLYASLVFLCFPDFIFVILPFLWRHYYNGVGENWAHLVFSHSTLIALFPLLLYLILYKRNPYRLWCTALLLTWLAFLIIYFSQHNTFYYHLLPSLAISMITSVVLIAVLLRQDFLSPYVQLCLFLMAILLALFFLNFMPIIWTSTICLPKEFLIFFAALFTFLFMAYKEPTVKIMIKVLAILGISAIAFYMLQRVSGSEHQFIIMIFLLLALFGLFAPRRKQTLFSHILIALLSTYIFSYALYSTYYVYSSILHYNETTLQRIIRFANSTKTPHSFYFLSDQVSYSAVLLNYSPHQYVQRFDCLWPIRAFMSHANQEPSADENAFMNMVADDLYLQKPDWVFVDRRDYEDLVLNTRIDYIRFFSRNTKFREAWKNYHYLTELKFSSAYKIAVFQRNP